MSKTYTILHTDGETRHGKHLLTELLLVPRDSQFTQGSYIVLEEDNAGIRQLAIAQPTVDQRIRFAIICTKTVYNNPIWHVWANLCLRGIAGSKHFDIESEAQLAAQQAAFDFIQSGKSIKMSALAALWSIAAVRVADINESAWAAAKAATLAIAAGNMLEMTVSLAAEEACE